MDEREFKRVLNLFPVVRSRDYCADSALSESTSKSSEDEVNEWQNSRDAVDEKNNDGEDINNHDPFWQKLKSATEIKVGPAEAEKFCEAFHRVYRKLVSRGQNLDVIQRFVDAAGSYRG